MPNYRNKNRNRNKNKQRNKQQQQQQQQKAENTKTDCKTDTRVPTIDSQESPPPLPPTVTVASQNTATEVKQINASAVALDHKNVAKIDAAAVASAAIIEEVLDVTTSASNTITINDTVLNEPLVCENYSESEQNYAVKTVDNMGNEKSKLSETNEEQISPVTVSANVSPPKSPLVATTTATETDSTKNVLAALKDQHLTTKEASKVVTPNVVKSSKAATEEYKQREEELAQAVNKIVKQDIISESKNEEEPFKVLIHNILNTQEEELPLDKPKIPTETQQTQPSKVIIHKISMDSNKLAKAESEEEKWQQSTDEVTIKENESLQTTKRKEPEPQEPPAKVIVHKAVLAGEDADNEADDSSSQSDTTETATQHQVKVIVHQIHVEGKDDSVEEQPIITSPKQREPIPSKTKLSTSDVHIVEISEESLSDLEELRSPVVSEAESSVEHSDEIERVSDLITEISSTTSSSSTKTSQKQARKQKRIALEHHFLPQMLSPRFLDSISEENIMDLLTFVCAAKTENDNAGYRNDYENCYNDVNFHVDDGNESDVSTLKSHTYQPFSNIPNTSNEIFSPFPGSLDEMFGKSPFRSRIFEEFNNYWRNFHYTGNNNF